MYLRQPSIKPVFSRLRHGVSSTPSFNGSILEQIRTKPLPAQLRRGMERLTGVDLQKVRVHYNSHKPALVQAHAYAQGEDIYLAPGQEAHLPHELGHVVQQKLGMVEPTMEVNGVAVNDDPKLEAHATELGERAMGLEAL